MLSDKLNEIEKDTKITEEERELEHDHLTQEKLTKNKQIESLSNEINTINNKTINATE